MPRKLSEPSPQTSARATRMRIASEESARAMAEAERDAAAVRKNMDRLRALREAREAEQAATDAANPPPAAKAKPARRVKRIVR